MTHVVILMVAVMALASGCTQSTNKQAAALTSAPTATTTPAVQEAVDATAQAVAEAAPEVANEIAVQENAVSEQAQDVATQAQATVQSAADAIKESLNQGATQQQIDYLLNQAKSFIGAEKYDQVVEIANHILTNLDQNSPQAKELLATAQAKLQEKGGELLSNTQNKLNALMK